MTHEMDLSELQELRKQFNLIDEKLDKQRIINEEILRESMKSKLSRVELWYQNRFRTSAIAAPIIGIVFLTQFADKGFHYWGFCLLIIATGILEVILNNRAYKALSIGNLPSMSMTEATEHIARHKQLRMMANRILAIPLIALIVWTILIASDFAWNLQVIAITVFAMGVAFVLGITQQRANKKRLDEVLHQIKTLRG
ncbi:MAG: hypothetical protein IKJ09_08115 [Bacteroidaceae bacterium]|nr:hypothetical protein [Bacteroidaceae bacterium]